MIGDDLRAAWRGLFATWCARIEEDRKTLPEAREILHDLLELASDHGVPYNEAAAAISAFIRARYPEEWRTDAPIPSNASPDEYPRDVNATGGFVLTLLSDLLREPEEQVDYVVDGMLPTAGLSALVAKPKVGKSTLARQLALAVARGEEFLGRKTIRGPVIYLALEEKRSEVRSHFRAMGAKEGEVYLHFGTAPENPLSDLVRLGYKIGPVLVIVDPLFRLARVRDANDYAQVLAALEPFLAFARTTGAHVAVVHHAGKSERAGGDAILGSTAILASVDTAVMLKRGDRYRTIWTVQRYGIDLEETVLEFDPETRTASLGDSRQETDEHRLAGEIETLLRGRTLPATEAEVLADVEGKTGPKRKALRRLVRGNTVERTGEGRKGNPFVYRLNPRSVVPEAVEERRNENTTTAENALQHLPDSRSTEIIEPEGTGDEKPEIASTSVEPASELDRSPDWELF